VTMQAGQLKIANGGLHDPPVGRLAPHGQGV
jgi:hypothetical protein